MANVCAHRGIQGIRDIKQRMQQLVKFYGEFRPDVHDLTCRREDYDLIQRWPRAAHVEGFVVSDNGIYFQGLRLAYDTGPGRYVQPATPEQQVIP